VERINVIDNPDPMVELGIRRFPALAHEERTFSVLFMTRSRIRRFLKSI
jgi:hypothetical protein